MCLCLETLPLTYFRRELCVVILRSTVTLDPTVGATVDLFVSAVKYTL